MLKSPNTDIYLLESQHSDKAAVIGRRQTDNMSKPRRLWSPEEDAILRTLVQAYDNEKVDWRLVASYLPGRNNKDCRKRWHYRVSASMNLGSWSAAEDELLRAGIHRYGTHWARVAQVVGTRNGDQCFKRWNDVLNPSIDRSPWTQEEDRLLHLAIRQYGRSWKQIVDTHFPGRTGLDAKNRHRQLTRKSKRRNHTHGHEADMEDSSRMDQINLEPPSPVPYHQPIPRSPSTSQAGPLSYRMGNAESQLEPLYDERCLSAPPYFNSEVDLEEWPSTIFPATPFTTRSHTPMTINSPSLLDFDYYSQPDAMTTGLGYDHPVVPDISYNLSTGQTEPPFVLSALESNTANSDAAFARLSMLEEISSYFGHADDNSGVRNAMAWQS